MKDVQTQVIVTDPGIDDIVGLLIAASSYDDLGFISTYGNAEETLTAKNLQGVFQFISRFTKNTKRNLSIYRGADRSGDAKKSYIPEGGDLFWIHGPNACEGLFQEVSPADVTSDKLYDKLAEEGTKVGVISVAAVTEVANLLSRQDVPNVTSLTVMGGVIFSQGNITPHVEANFAHDPKALVAIFEEVKNRNIDMLLVPLDLTQHPSLEFTPERLEKMRKKLGDKEILSILETLLGEKSAYRKFYNSKRSVRLPQSGEERIFRGPILHDATAVLARRHPELFRIVTMKLTVKDDGSIEAPTSWMKEYGNAYDIPVAIDIIDHERYWDMVGAYLSSYI